MLLEEPESGCLMIDRVRSYNGHKACDVLTLLISAPSSHVDRILCICSFIDDDSRVRCQALLRSPTWITGRKLISDLSEF